MDNFVCASGGHPWPSSSCILPGMLFLLSPSLPCFLNPHFPNMPALQAIMISCKSSLGLFCLLGCSNWFMLFKSSSAYLFVNRRNNVAEGFDIIILANLHVWEINYNITIVAFKTKQELKKDCFTLIRFKPRKKHWNTIYWPLDLHLSMPETSSLLGMCLQSLRTL